MAGDLWRDVLFDNSAADRGASWLQIRLRGTQSHLDGVGATLRVRVGDAIYTRVVTAGGAFGSTNSLWAHFGLGGATVVDEIGVSWPGGDGVPQRFTGVSANQAVAIIEGGPLVENVR